MNPNTPPPAVNRVRVFRGREFIVSLAHPAADAFPWIEDEDELQALADDIAANGQEDDIIRLPDGRLVDGRNRELACLIAGKTPRYRKSQLDDAEIVALVASRNIHRRHLNHSQRAMIAAALAKLAPGSNQHENKGVEVVTQITTSPTQGQVAEQLNVSRELVNRAASVMKNAPELVETVKSGKLDVKTAAKAAKLPQAKRKKIAAAKNPKAEAKKQIETESPAPAKIVPPSGTDAWGIPIQPHAEEAFTAVPKFNELIALLRKVRGELTALCEHPGGRHLLRRCQFEKANNKAGGRWVMADLDNAIRLLESTTPKHTDCPYQFNAEQPHFKEGGRRCPLCDNLRFTGTLKQFQVPPEMLSKMKEHYGVSEKEAV